MTPAAFTPLAIQPQTQPPKQPRSATHLGNASSSASSRLPSNALRSRCASPPTFFLCGVPPAPSSFSGPAPTASSATVPGLPSPRPLLRPLGTAARFGLLAVRRRIRRHQARPRPQAPLAQPVCGFQQRLSHHPRPSPRPHSCCWRLRRASHRLLRPLRRLRHHARSQSAPTMPRQAVHPHLAHEPFAASAVGCARWGHRRIHNLFSVNGHRRIDVAHRRPAARLGPARPVPSLSLHLHHRRRPRLSAHPFTILCMPTHSPASRPLSPPSPPPSTPATPAPVRGSTTPTTTPLPACADVGPSLHRRHLCSPCILPPPPTLHPLPPPPHRSGPIHRPPRPNPDPSSYPSLPLIIDSPNAVATHSPAFSRLAPKPTSSTLAAGSVLAAILSIPPSARSRHHHYIPYKQRITLPCCCPSPVPLLQSPPPSHQIRRALYHSPHPPPAGLTAQLAGLLFRRGSAAQHCSRRM